MEDQKLKPFRAAEVGLTDTQMERYGIKDPEKLVQLSKEVAKYVESNTLSTVIQGSKYVMVEGWQFAAGLLGLVGKTLSYKNESSYNPVEFVWRAKDYNKNAWVEKKHKTKEFKYFAEAAFFTADGQEISKGFAMCTNEEVKKHTFDEYSILSMAQTRAIGKAARMSFAFLIKAAGYEPTPAEEMPDTDEAEANAVVVELPEDIENEILIHTNADDLAKWANEQKQYHSNSKFVMEVKKRLIELNKENGNTGKNNQSKNKG